jgi:hypothetical protein
MENVRVAEVPPAVCTASVLLPADAPLATETVAVRDVALLTLTLLADSPVPATICRLATSKFVPVNVTEVDEPCPPVLGEMLVSVGAGELTTKLPEDVNL